MIAVQALETRTADLQRENELLKETVDASKRENTRLQAKLAALENRIVAQETRQPK